jgi:biopolymer transport protein ExbD
MADQKTPYRTLKAVMNSAANAGFGDFKLIVVEDR